MQIRQKHIILSMILSIWSLMGWAQTVPPSNYVLKSIESGSTKSYIAKDYVSLQNGFHYAASGANTFSAKIDPYTIDANPFTNQIATTPDANGNSYVVGGTSGSASVSPSGAASYEIPIKVAPGTAGMTPQISIVYSSQGLDGLLGVGFSISGLSSISRTPRNIRDGDIRPVSLSAWDMFSLDGSKLVAISGYYGYNGTEYRTENNSFSKIISYTTTTTGPESFVVYTKSGLIYEYGNTADSKFKVQNDEHVITWLLNKVTDTKGNYYTISYIQDLENGEYKPDRIDYTGNDNSIPKLGPYCSIRFGYVRRTTFNGSITFIKGNKSIVSSILTNVDVYYQEDIVKSYALRYKTPYYGKYLLSNVAESSATGEKVAPITFEWNTNNNFKPKEWAYDESYYAEQFVKNDNPIYTGDFNGDGKTDFIATPKSGTYANKWGLFLANESGSKCSYTSSAVLLDGFKKLYTGDFNGDGKTDIIQCRQASGSPYTNYFVYYSTGTGFAYGGQAFLTETRSCELVIGDFKGDGISDVLAYYPGANDYQVFTASYSDGVVTSLVKNSIGAISINWDRVETGDFNGDGLTDILNLDENGSVYLYCNGSGSSFTKFPGGWKKNHHFKLGDFNGDGKTDFLVTGYYNPENGIDYDWDNWQLHLTTGAVAEQHDIPKKFNTSQKEIFIADLNGDGKDDFFAVNKTGNNGSTGMAKMGLYISNDLDFSYQDGNYVYSLDVWDFYCGDFNGDGRTDYINKSNFTEGFSGYQLQNSITDRDNLLKSVTDSYGNTTSFTYKPLTDKTVYTPSTCAVYPVSDFTSALQVVDKMTQPNGFGGIRSTSYKYAGAKLHKRGNGFLGFSKFTSTDDMTGISSIAIYDYDPTYYVVGLKRTETRITKGTYTNFLLSETDYVNEYQIYNQNYKIYTYQQSGVTDNKYELGSTTPYSTTISSYTYDDYGNVLTISQYIPDANASMSTTNVYTNDITKWFLGRLTSATVSKHIGHELNVSLRNSTFEYDPISGMVTKEIVEPDNALLGFSKTYAHDAFGNILTTTTTANGKSRVNTSVYDDKGRFAEESYDALNHKTKKVFDPVYGSVTSMTDANSLSATTTYDSFGREKTSTGPDGFMSVAAYRWCTGDADAPTGAVWFKYAEVSGKPGAKAYYDKFGRVIRKAAVSFDGSMIFSDTEYNALGQVSRQSDPYFKGGTSQWTSFIYDELGRLKQKTLPDASTIKMTYNGLTIVTENPLGQKDTHTTNMQGLLVTSTNDASKSITYVYNSAGSMTEMHDSKGNIIKMEYDIVGNRTKLDDPELGVTTSVFNAFGEMTSLTDPKGNLMSLEYDDLGRMKKRTETEGITEWTYDTGTCGIGRLASVTSPGGYVQSTEYDKLGRVSNMKETIAGTTYTTSTDYDVYSRVLRTHYPSVNGSGPVIRNKYNAYGYLSTVSDNQTGKVYWTAGTVNARGQMTQSLYGNGMQTTRTYDPLTGLLTHINTAKGTSAAIQDWEYAFDALGNLKTRTDDKRGLSETFEYDSLSRLLNVKKNNVQTLAMTYNELGNILTKSDVGEYAYANTLKPHTVTGITPYAGSILNSTTQDITYTSFDKVSTITQGTDKLILSYGSAYQRIYGDSYQSDVLKKRRTYVNSLYEQEKDYTTNNIKETFYIFGGDGLVAIRVKDTSGDNVSYVHKDHLGSIQCLTNDTGTLAQEMSYDAWGKRRDPITWLPYTSPQSGLITDRGFTGHEHIDLFDLVNMDGRVYDPVIGRFLSADPVIQDPENLQSLNRYSYCINNPLSLTDPSGYSWISDNWRSLAAAGIAITVSVFTAGLGSGLGIAIIAGAAGGFAGGFSGVLLNGGNLGQALVAGVIGGAIGGAAGFLSFAAGSVTSKGVGAILEKAAKHAFGDAWMGGVKSAISGGEWSPIRDMIGGALSSVGNGFINEDVNGLTLKMASSAVLGGTISEIGGGKFANGAITGAYSMLFNEIVHDKREQFARSAELSRRNKDPYLHCNEFVQAKLVENGMNPTDKALNAGEWGDPNAEILAKLEDGGWEQLKLGELAQRGDIAAAKYRFPSGATGHMGIMVSNTRMIYAGGQNPYVVKSEISTILPDKLKFVYYRYVGK